MRFRVHISIKRPAAVHRQAVALSQSQTESVLGALLHGSCKPNQRFGQLLKRRTLQMVLQTKIRPRERERTDSREVINYHGLEAYEEMTSPILESIAKR